MKQGWEIKKMLDVVDFQRGLTYSKNDEVEISDNVVLRSNNVDLKTNKLDFTELKYINPKIVIPENKKVKKGSLIICTANGSKSHLGKVALIDDDYDYAFGGFMGLIKPKENLNSDFLFHLMTSEAYKKFIGGLSDGANINNLKFGDLGKFEIPLPPLHEQKRIVSILDEAFAAIAKAKANAEENLKNAKELFEVYLHKYYTSKEEGWEQKNLKEVAEYFNGLTYSPKDVGKEGIIVLRSSNVQNDDLDFNDIVRVKLTVKEKIIVKDGDILMCSRNGSARLVGKTATIKNLDEEMTFGTFMMIIRSEYNPYLSWFFKSTNFRNQIKGGENTMINQITRYMLDDVVLSFPTIDKQNEIVQQLDALSKEIRKLDIIYNKKINDLEELKKVVLQKAFSGELKTVTALV
jgi:type I restriction enzyme S subunit